MKYSYAIIILLMTIIVACSKDEVLKPEIQSDSVILPLAQDNYWVYSDSSFVDGSLSTTETSKIGITGYSRITYQNTKKWVYHWNWYDMPEDKPRNTKTLVINEADGLVYYGQKIGSSYSTINRSLFIKYPVGEGDEWSYTGTTLIRCVSDSTEFETPAGVFNTYVYEVITTTQPYSVTGQTRNGIKQYLYYTPEIGYVGLIKKDNDEVVFSRRLVEYLVTDSLQ